MILDHGHLIPVIIPQKVMNHDRMKLFSKLLFFHRFPHTYQNLINAGVI
jgi:hypothetical protein